jgi:TolB protein
MQIVFVSKHEDERGDIYIMNANGSDMVLLAFSSDYEDTPSWSPDGGWVAFSSDRSGNHQLYVVRADGQKLTRLTDNGAWSPAWQP